MELILIFASLVLLASAWWAYKRWFRVFNFGEGVQQNGDYILQKLDDANISYNAQLPVDGSCMMDAPMDIGGGVAVNVVKYAEVALAIIDVNTMVGDREVRKTVTISGSNIPGPNIRIALTPLHCWGFEPHVLTRFNRDPKFSDTHYIQTPVYPNTESQLLSKEILDIVARFLIWPVPENLVDLYWDDMFTMREWSYELDDE